MKIAQVHIEQVQVGEETQVLVVLHADNGATGVGEAASTRSPSALFAALETAGQYLLGQDPFDRNSILMQLARAGGSKLGEVLSAVLNGIEAACLDLSGKQLGVPACQLFGVAVRNEVRACAIGWLTGEESAEELARKAMEVASVGFTALEFDPCPPETRYMRFTDWERAVKMIHRIREAVGDRIDLILDAKGRFTAPEAIAFAGEVLPFRLLYLQDPVPGGDLNALGEVRRVSPIPIAVCDYGSSFATLREVIERQLADFVHLDCVRLGGISRARDFALLAESWSMDVTLHHSGGPVAWAANTQIAAAAPNFLMADLPYPVTKSWSEMMNASFELKNGCLNLPSGGGLAADCVALRSNAQPV
jgi:L-alanine-DL-glutamate epimerase-like enolase superfamily enzyme